MLPYQFVSLIVSVSLIGTLVMCDLEEFVVRQTVYGEVRGQVLTVLGNSTVERFLGIPYAAPPTGELRFENPREPPTWTDILNATEIPPACPQTSWNYIEWHTPGFNYHDEDCLYINIDVPKTEGNNISDRAVLVHVHGGSNAVGMAAMFHGDVLAVMGNIIVVTFNYRLGLLGFLSGGNDDFPGNYGLLDQTLALSWVKKNIHFFGGDPAKVTLQGHSAGSSDVGLHLLSPMSKGLFRYAIMLSGTPTGYWAFTRPPLDPAVILETVASHYGCSSHSTAEIKQCLKVVPWQNTLNHSQDFRLINNYLPVTDNIFIHNAPENLLDDTPLNGHAYMMGITRDEGSLMVNIDKDFILTQASALKQIPDHMVPESFPELLNIIQQEYAPWSDPLNHTANVIGLSNIHGDVAIVAPVVDFARRIAERNETIYFYSFEYQSPTYAMPSWRGVSHGQDLFYLFGYPFTTHPRHEFADEDRQVSRMVIEIWSSFIKNGTPSSSSFGATPVPRFSSNSQRYIKLSAYKGNATVVKSYRPFARRVHFWNSLVSELQRSMSQNSGNNTGSCTIAWVFIAITGFLFILVIVLVGCVIKSRR